MSLTPGAGRPSLPDNLNRGLFMRINLATPILLWSGTRNIRVDGELFLGLPIIREFPDFDRLINGQARRVTVQLNGLDKRIADLIDSDAPDIENAHVRLGHMRFNRRWQPTGEVRWAFDGVLDEIGLEWAQAGGGHEWTATISISSAMVERNRPLLQFWTPVEMNVISPTDRGFDYIPSYSAGTTRPYPPR